MRKTDRRFKSPSSILSVEEIAKARSLVDQNHSFSHIARGFGCDRETVMRALDPQFRARRAEQIAQAKMRYAASGITIKRILEPRMSVPDDVMEDRERRLSVPRSVTSTLCGDPPAGYSALDRRS